VIVPPRRNSSVSRIESKGGYNATCIYSSQPRPLTGMAEARVESTGLMDFPYFIIAARCFAMPIAISMTLPLDPTGDNI
jgi:hypothetical protein